MVLNSTEESDSIAADVNEQTLLKNLKLQFVGETSRRAGWGPTGRKTDKQIRKPKKHHHGASAHNACDVCKR